MKNKFKVFAVCLGICIAMLLLIGFQGSAFFNDSMKKQAAAKSQLDPLPSASYDRVFESSIPIVAIETDGEEIKLGDDIWCRFYVYDREDGRNSVENTPDMRIFSTIHSRGQSSASFDKKGYFLEFYKEVDGQKKEYEVLGMAKGTDWVLHGPYLDKSLMRNYLSYTLSREIMFYAPDSRYCEVYLNGEYIGLYLMLEKPKISKTRINFSEKALLNGETSYLLQRNRDWDIRSYTKRVGKKQRREGDSGIDVDLDALYTYGLRSGNVQVPLFVVFPNSKKITADQFQYIEEDISRFERVLYSESFLDSQSGYKNYIDMDSFVEYYLIMEFSMNKDNGYYSTYVCKNVGDKLMMGPVWDFNNAFNNYVTGATDPEDGFVIADNNWYVRMTRDRAFVDAAIEKWAELREDVLSEQRLLTMLDETEEMLGDSITRNNERWDYVFKKNMLKGDRDVYSYEEAQEQLRDFIVRRGRYLDENLDRLYANCLN